jgi:hypothetical protein
VSIELICDMFAAIIDKLGHKILPGRKADSDLDDDDNEEKKWRR